MSFILDALRKSEMERQRDAAARVMRIPVAEHKEVRLPRWVGALIAVLAVGVIVLAGTAWRGWHTSNAERVAVEDQAKSEASSAEPTAALRSPAAARTAGVSSQQAPRRTPGAAAATAARTHATAKALSTPEKAGGSPPVKAASIETTPPPPPSDPTALPSMAELAADGVQVPPLTLQLHVYSKDASQRFVFINGERYQEGQRTAEGPILVSVTPKGAVLSQRGREFYLPVQ